MLVIPPVDDLLEVVEEGDQMADLQVEEELEEADDITKTKEVQVLESSLFSKRVYSMLVGAVVARAILAGKPSSFM